MTILVSLISFAIGIAFGWYAEHLLKLVRGLFERKPVTTGVVRTEVAPNMQPPTTSGVVRPKSPKEIARENEKKFNDEFQI